MITCQCSSSSLCMLRIQTARGMNGLISYLSEFISCWLGAHHASLEASQLYKFLQLATRGALSTVEDLALANFISRSAAECLEPRSSTVME